MPDTEDLVLAKAASAFLDKSLTGRQLSPAVGSWQLAVGSWQSSSEEVQLPGAARVP